jgi:hypothetical protein
VSGFFRSIARRSGAFGGVHAFDVKIRSGWFLRPARPILICVKYPGVGATVSKQVERKALLIDCAAKPDGRGELSYVRIRSVKPAVTMSVRAQSKSRFSHALRKSAKPNFS